MISPQQVQELQAIAYIISALCALVAATFGARWAAIRAIIIGRTQIQAFRARHRLASENADLRKQNAELTAERDYAKRQAYSAHLAADNFESALSGVKEEMAAKFAVVETRMQAIEESRQRFEAKVVALTPKFEAAIVYVRTLTLHILRLVKTMLDHGIDYDPSFAVPDPPAQLVEDLTSS